MKGQEEVKMEELEQKTITSMEVAEMVGKSHNELLKDIRRYISQFGEGKIPHTDFFNLSEYTSSQNKKVPCYMVTKKGCEFIAHKLTGTKGTEFTAKYINRFHEMERQISIPSDPIAQIQIIAQGYVEIDKKVEGVQRELNDFRDTLPLLAVDCDKITTAVKKKALDFLGGKQSNAYADKNLRSRVYQDLHREVRHQFGVSNYKAIQRNQMDKALQFISEYRLPFVLQSEIQDVNAQIRIEDAV